MLKMHLKGVFFNIIIKIGADKYACFIQMHIVSILAAIQNKLSRQMLSRIFFKILKKCVKSSSREGVGNLCNLTYSADKPVYINSICR